MLIKLLLLLLLLQMWRFGKRFSHLKRHRNTNNDMQEKLQILATYLLKKNILWNSPVLFNSLSHTSKLSCHSHARSVCQSVIHTYAHIHPLSVWERSRLCLDEAEAVLRTSPSHPWLPGPVGLSYWQLCGPGLHSPPVLHCASLPEGHDCSCSPTQELTQAMSEPLTWG